MAQCYLHPNRTSTRTGAVYFINFICNLKNRCSVFHISSILFVTSTCFGPLQVRHRGGEQLYLFDTWYLLFCIADRLVCRSICSYSQLFFFWHSEDCASWYILKIKPRCTISQIYSLKYSTRFGQDRCPSSGVSQHCIHAIVVMLVTLNVCYRGQDGHTPDDGHQTCPDHVEYFTK